MPLYLLEQASTADMQTMVTHGMIAYASYLPAPRELQPYLLMRLPLAMFTLQAAFREAGTFNVIEFPCGEAAASYSLAAAKTSHLTKVALVHPYI
jgi:hypothetical protein